MFDEERRRVFSSRCNGVVYVVCRQCCSGTLSIKDVWPPELRAEEGL